MSKIQMPEKSGEEDEDEQSWTQTLITITPEENAAIRTIVETTVISAVRDTPLVLRVDQISDRRTVQFNTIRQDLFIDNAELEERIIRNDAECQTFLQGIPKVELPSVLKDEATQTMYLGNIHPYNPHSFKDITRIMNDRIMPSAEKVTEMTQTVLTFKPDAPRNYIVDHLTSEITANELQANNSSYEKTTDVSYTYVKDSLNFILERVLWLTNPDDCVPEVKLKDEVVQTFIKFDYGLGKVVLDADTQTSLTCEPKRSNTGLLTEWSAIKEFTRDMIDECIEIGVYPRIIAHSIIDEIIDRCASQIHLPYRDKIMQTLAPCNALNDEDDEVLRKLRIEIVLDTLESSIIVLPLIEILIERTCVDICRDAPIVAVEILNRIQKNSVTIATRLAAIRQEAVSHKPMDDIFEARNKRLRELLQNKIAKKLSSGTQTELAGVPDIMKVKEPRETVCSTCVGHSECYTCYASLDNEELDPVNKNRENIVQGKILRTQDILIAYNPCYVVATPSKIPKIQSPIVPRQLPVASVTSKQPKRLSRINVPASASDSTSFKRRLFDDVCRTGQKSAKLKGKGGAIQTQSRTPVTGSSLNDWAKVARDTSSISGVWSIHGSSSSDSRTIRRQVGSSSTCLLKKPPNIECPGSRYNVFLRSVKALGILKKTFNQNEESCSDCSYDEEKINVKLSEQGSGGVSTCSKSSDKKSEENADQQTSQESGFHGNSYDECVRVVPIVYIPNQINKN